MTRYQKRNNENEQSKNIDGFKKAKHSEQFNIDFNIILNQLMLKKMFVFISTIMPKIKK